LATTPRTTKGLTMTTPTDELISDAQIIKAFHNTNFGEKIQSPEQQKLYLRCAVMKSAMGYYSGFTITSIMKELNLIKKDGLPNKKGRDLLKGLYDQLAYKP